MFASNESIHVEYAALMNRTRALEHTGLASWTVSTTAAVALMAWGVNAGNPGIMLPVIFAVAAGYLPLQHARQQMKLTAAYVEEFVEAKGGGAQWFSRVGQLNALSSAGAPNDWVMTATSNLVVLAATVSAWLYTSRANHGELFAGTVTACAVAFVLHSVTEMTRLGQVDYATMWRKAGGADRARTSNAA
jgi:hypothetical protein